MFFYRTKQPPKHPADKNDMLKKHAFHCAIASVGLVVGCTVANPKYCPDKKCPDAGAQPVDGSMPDPKTTIRVSLGGNDAADGLSSPVKTLKRAISIATSNGAIKTIRLETGKYSAANGETYPYTVPAGITILGDPGTVLAGTNNEIGFVVETGSLTNLEFNDFTTAIHTKGTATLDSVVVRTSKVGVLADGSAKVTAKGLTFTGDAKCTTVGVLAAGTAQVIVETFSSADVLSVDHRDQAVVSISKGTITSKGSGCDPLVKASGKSLTLGDTVISGGSNGIYQYGSNGILEITLLNTIIADSEGYAIRGDGHVLRMTGGEIRTTGVTLTGGTSSFTNVGIKGSPVHAVLVNPGPEPARTTLRGCTILRNTLGVMVFTGAIDFGTAADPGNNTFRENPYFNLVVGGIDSSEILSVTAVGNSWNAGRQGANSEGKYGPQLIQGPVTRVDGNNFAILNGSSIQL